MKIENEIELKEFVKLSRMLIIQGCKSNDKCFAASSLLRDMLNVVGINCNLVFGQIEHAEYYHTWLITESGITIDITADQFKSPDGVDMPDIIFGEKPEWYEILCIENNDLKLNKQ